MNRVNKIPLKVGVQLDSPAIVYIYKELGTLRMRRMPLRNFWANTDVEFVLEDFRNRHGKHIEDIPDRALRRMLNIVKQNKQGKSLQQILNGNKSEEKESGETFEIKNETIFNKLKNNVKVNIASTDSSKENDLKNKDIFNKKVFPKGITFTTLYDSGNEFKENEGNHTNDNSNELFLGNRKNNTDLDFQGGRDVQTKRPTTLELNNYELSTSFNSINTQDRQIRPLKSGFLQDLEKDLTGIEFPEKENKDDHFDRITEKRGQFAATKKVDAKLISNNLTNNDRPDGNSKTRNEDDTDVEFDDSDNPLDDPEEDFW